MVGSVATVAVVRRRHALVLVLVLAATAAGVVCAPASAATRRGELLQDRAPTGTSFADRVLTEPRASTGQAAYRAYDTGDGTAVRVAVSSRYADGAALAQ